MGVIVGLGLLGELSVLYMGVCGCVWSKHNFVILYCPKCSVLMPLLNFSF